MRHTTSGRHVVALLAAAGPTMSVRDSARVLQCHPTTLYEMIKRGDMDRLNVRVLQLGRAVRIVTADLRRAVGEDTTEPKGAA